jgi:hypothetical protein
MTIELVGSGLGLDSGILDWVNLIKKNCQVTDWIRGQFSSGQIKFQVKHYRFFLSRVISGRVRSDFGFL